MSLARFKSMSLALKRQGERQSLDCANHRQPFAVTPAIPQKNIG
jgi:hypothetical protein